MSKFPHRNAVLIAALFGLVGTFAQGFTSAWYLLILSVAGLCWLLFRPGRRVLGPKIGFLIGMAWGLSYFVVGVGWLFISMHRYGAMPAPLAAAGVLALATLLASFGAVACAVSLRFERSFWAQATMFSALWGLTEWTRGWIFTGFPWLALGYSQLDGPLESLAPFIGVFGISILVCLLGASLSRGAWQLKERRWFRSAKIVGATLSVILLCHFGAKALPTFSEPSGPAISVRLVQGNIPQEMKFDADKARAADRKSVV